MQVKSTSKVVLVFFPGQSELDSQSKDLTLFRTNVYGLVILVYICFLLNVRLCCKVGIFYLSIEKV